LCFGPWALGLVLWALGIVRWSLGVGSGFNAGPLELLLGLLLGIGCWVLRFGHWTPGLARWALSMSFTPVLVITSSLTQARRHYDV
jgi:hypothetical protein